MIFLFSFLILFGFGLLNIFELLFELAGKLKSAVEFNTVLLEGLAQDILEQVYEDNPYASLENVYYDVLDNCIFVIKEMENGCDTNEG